MSKTYQHLNFHLTQYQLNKVENAIKSANPVSIKFSKKNLTIVGNHALPVSNVDLKKVAEGKAFNYFLSKDKLKTLKLGDNEGGFLPILGAVLAGIGAVGGLAGSATAIAKTVIDKNVADKQLTEQQRHNIELENIAKGSGAYLNPYQGTGAYLNPYNQSGEGLTDVKKTIDEFMSKKLSAMILFTQN